MKFSSTAASLAVLAASADAFRKGPVVQSRPRDNRKGPAIQISPRQLPAEPAGVQTIQGPSGATITYKEPGKEGVCETTPGVNSYSGFVNLGEDVHSFFWFFESRRDPANDPLTLWLNGGPGSDSLIGLFQELGPCNVTEELVTQLNPYAWNEVSNMLFLSQPVGVGFSYSRKAPGSLDPVTGAFVSADEAEPDGRYAIYDPSIDTTDLAAMAAWEVIQGFYSALPQLAPNVTSTTFNLATESYGGHYGPAFFNYFYNQNQLIQNGTIQGKQLEFNSLTLINAIIDEEIQAPYYPEFANHNTYGITGLNETEYNYAKYALTMPNGCLDQVALCRQTNTSTPAGQALCAEASSMCRDNVEGPYEAKAERGVYDIRHPADDPTPPDFLVDFLNLDSTREALGVDTNYTGYSNNDIYFAFAQTGDFVYMNFLEDLEQILNNSVRVAMIYGDADYICNWFGGEAVSKAIAYTHTEEFNAAGYTPMLVDGVQYGETREYGNFSFTRVYEAGHEVPYYQPVAALQLFNRTIFGWDLATGQTKVTEGYGTTGTEETTHTAVAPPLPSETGSGNATARSGGLRGVWWKS